jgi:glycosyltransferase involved in cell wall biosynthesis
VTPGTSVALATFNGEAFLPPQLQSLADQTRLPAELVICDDGSTDRTLEAARDFARSAPFPVRIVRNEMRLGYRANFMRAAGLCRLDLIAFCDQDDVWDADKLAVMERQFEDPDVLLAYHNATIVDAHGKPAGHLYKPGTGTRTYAPLAREPWGLVAGLTQVFRRSLCRFSSLHAASIDPYWPSQRLAHDQWFLFLASVLGSVVRVARPLARYRQHDGNVFGGGRKHWLESPPGCFLRCESFVAAAQNRAQLLRAMAGDAGAGNTARVSDAIAFYDELYRRLDDRVAVYSSAALATRAGAFRALLRQHAYRRSMGAARFGWEGLLVDAFAGLLFGPFARRIMPKLTSGPADAAPMPS